MYGINVANGKPTTATLSYSGICNYYSSYAVDGILAAKNFDDCSDNAYHSSVWPAYWMVDLGQEENITKVVYYNRADNGHNARSTGYNLVLLNSAYETVCYNDSFSTDFIQDLALVSGNLNSYFAFAFF